MLCIVRQSMQAPRRISIPLIACVLRFDHLVGISHLKISTAHVMRCAHNNTTSKHLSSERKYHYSYSH